jgi:hypothetical protein
MFRPGQIVSLVALGIAFWLFVTVNIRLHPDAALDPVRGLIGFITAPLGGLLSVWLCKFVGRLNADQLLPGVAVVGAVAMMMDGAALRWWSDLYGFNDTSLRHSAAGLLWGYGIGFGVALLWTSWSRRKTGTQPAAAGSGGRARVG